jgi:hypothetical protein
VQSLEDDDGEGRVPVDAVEALQVLGPPLGAPAGRSKPGGAS